VTVELDDLDAAVGPSNGGGSSTRDAGMSAEAGSSSRSAAGSGSASASAIRIGRMRSVASSLDLRGARVEEALELLERYVEDASLAGLDRVTIVHGLGTGALRDAVRSAAARHPLVRSLRAGERGEGGDGATIVEL
jgi:DNA mismatch repair protein MutS2